MLKYLNPFSPQFPLRFWFWVFFLIVLITYLPLFLAGSECDCKKKTTDEEGKEETKAIE